MCAFESEVFVLPTSVRIWHWDGPLSDTATNKSTVKLPNSIPVTPAEMNLSAPGSQLWRLGSRAGGRSMSVFFSCWFPAQPPHHYPLFLAVVQTPPALCRSDLCRGRLTDQLWRSLPWWGGGLSVRGSGSRKRIVWTQPLPRLHRWERCYWRRTQSNARKHRN